MKKIWYALIDGVLYKNPLFVLMLGTCASLAVTTSVTNAIGMGAAVTVVMTCSNVLISMLRKIIRPQIRIAGFIVIISGFTTIIQLLIKAFLPELDKSLGIFIPLIVVNCILFARAEAFASKNNVISSALDGLTMGVGYTVALILMGLLREVLGNGTLFGYELFGGHFSPIRVFIYPAGAFITLGILVACMNAVKGALADRKREKLKEGKSSSRAAVNASAEACHTTADKPAVQNGEAKK